MGVFDGNSARWGLTLTAGRILGFSPFRFGGLPCLWAFFSLLGESIGDYAFLPRGFSDQKPLFFNFSFAIILVLCGGLPCESLFQRVRELL